MFCCTFDFFCACKIRLLCLYTTLKKSMFYCFGRVTFIFNNGLYGSFTELIPIRIAAKLSILTLLLSVAFMFLEVQIIAMSCTPICRLQHSLNTSVRSIMHHVVTYNML